MNTMRMTGLLTVGVFLTFAATSHAGGFPRADDHAVQSLTQGVGVAELPILQRHPCDPEATLQKLMASACPRGCGAAVREDRSDRIRMRGQDWHLDVFGDGSMAEFSDDAARARAHSQGVSAADAMSQAALESAGRAYIAKALSSVITLKPGEALVPETTSARTEGGVGRDGVMAPTMTTGNRVAFTREINGIPVMGSGSKVTITFLNDGSVESFRYDWPAYTTTGHTQSMDGAGDILQRVQRVLGVRSGSGSPGQPVVMPQNPTSPGPIDLGADMQLERFECGYYDPGLRDRDPAAPVQAGCYYHAVHFLSIGGIVSSAGYSGAVPAAIQPEADDGWPEEALLRGVKASGAPAAGPAGTPGPNTHASPPGHQ